MVDKTFLKRGLLFLVQTNLNKDYHHGGNEDDDDVEEDQDDHYLDDADDRDDYDLAVDVPLQHWMALTEDH